MYRLLLLPFYIGKILYYFIMSIISFIFRPFRVTYNNKKADNKNNNPYHLTKEEKKIAKEEMLDYEEYIEAEERDDDYLDTDED